MRALVQRVSRAAVHTDGGHLLTEIGPGVLVLVGVHKDDTEKDAAYVAEKIANLRIFPDPDDRMSGAHSTRGGSGGRSAPGEMNLSVTDVGGSVLVVSQFTLYADTRKGRRPSFVDAARPEGAEPLVQAVVDSLVAAGIPTETGVFGAHMDVELINNGPVTVLIDTVT